MKFPNPQTPNPRDVKNLKKVGFLLLNFVLLYALFRIVIELGERFENPMVYYIGTTVYAVAAVALAIAFYILNGYKLENRLRERDELPVRWSDEKKESFLKSQAERARKAKILLLVILPLVVVLLISFIELYFFS